jgi:Zn-dependent protease with chaperone function
MSSSREYPAVFLSASVHNPLAGAPGTVQFKDKHLVFQGGGVERRWDEFAIKAYVKGTDVIIESTVSVGEKLKVSDLRISADLLDLMGVKATSSISAWWSSRTTLSAITILAGFAVVCLLALQLVRMNAKALARFISVEQETSWGDEAFESTFEKMVFPLGELTPEWEELVSKLTRTPQVARHTWKVHIIYGAQPNAYTIPGHYVFFTHEFILQSESAEEILGVLAHEFAHTMARHHVQQVVGDAAGQFLTSFVLGGGLGHAITSADQLNGLRYGREHEEEADALGLAYLQEAGVSARGLASFFKRAQSRRDLQIPQWVSTHPADAERIKRFEQHVANEPELPEVVFHLEKLKEQLKNHWLVRAGKSVKPDMPLETDMTGE